MPYRISALEIDRVRILPGAERYAHFVKRVADWEELWSLVDPADGKWCLMADDTARERVPVWPHPEYAAQAATGEWAGYRPERISLADWQAHWLPGIARDGRAIAVFPVETDAVSVEAERLAHDLEVALQDYG